MDEIEAEQLGIGGGRRGEFVYSNSLTQTSPSKIRLLTIQPPLPDSDFDRVRCNIVDHNFDETCPKYETLSYAWGDTSEKISIHCNSTDCYVTKQLERALCALRARKVNLPVWIDQICINQKDDQEKTVQVGIMGQIYSESVNTIAWLDDQEGSMRKGFGLISRLQSASDDEPDLKTAQRITDELERFNQQQALHESVAATYPISMKIIELRFGHLSQGDLNAIAAITNNAWFSRRWIVQEAALSTNLIFLNARIDESNHCVNQLSCSFESLSRAVSLGALARLNILFQMNRLESFTRVAALASTRFKYLDSQKLDFDLVELLVVFKYFQNGDPRDRLFSLCGFTSDRSDLGRIVPDYVAPPAKILAASFHQLMKSDRNLRLLELAESSRTYDGIPSWIPYNRTTKDLALLGHSDLNRLDWIHGSDVLHRMIGLIDEEDEEEEEEEEVTNDDDEHSMSTGSEEADMNDSEQEDPEDSLSSNSEQHQDESSASEDDVNSSCVYPTMLELEDDLELHLRGRVIDRIARIGPVILSPATNLVLGYAQTDANDFQRGLDEIQQRSDQRMLKGWNFWPVELLRILMEALSLGIAISHKFFVNLAETDTMVLEHDEGILYPTGEDIKTVYRRTITGGRDDIQSTMRIDELERTFNRWRRGTIAPQRLLNKIQNLLHLNRKVGGFRGAMVIMASLLLMLFFSDRFMFVYRSNLDLLGRRLAWTEGGLSAIVPSRSAVGDCITALDGAKLPFVLSPTGAKWELRGPTYVHGLMYSPKLREALDESIKLI